MSDLVFTSPSPSLPIARTTDADHDPILLVDHLTNVATRAEHFSNTLGLCGFGRAMGLLHDLGKYSADFQRKITSQSNDRVDHSTAGAIHAVDTYCPVMGRIMAYTIAGHHAGLTDKLAMNAGNAGLESRLRQRHHLTAALIGLPPPEITCKQTIGPLPDHINIAFAIRMLFSCLVDADRLTAEHERDQASSLKRAIKHKLPSLDRKLDRHLSELMKMALKTPINYLRAQLLKDCRDAALREPGFFRLTGPVGLGKTLSGMSFCLKHAIATTPTKQRIIYVAPFTSIIEQTADIFRKVFGRRAVLEHHSNIGEIPNIDIGDNLRLATENWDAPIIVTTAVQFFESLFAASAGRCRKLHRVANSVIFLDECQLIPRAFLTPILSALRELVSAYNVTIVLATATQPAFQTTGGFFPFKGIDHCHEIVRDSDEMRGAATRHRLTVTLPDDLTEPVQWPDLAQELLRYESVLCIVNLRADARSLHALLPPGTIHLSALMCAQHRSEAIQTIKERLNAKQPVRVISTQLIEAGVDVDFPVVYRALAGLDSLAQSGGRANRNGTLSQDGELIPGQLHVFVPPSLAGLPVDLRDAVDATRQILRDLNGDEPFSAEQFQRYFRKLYQKGNLDAHHIMDFLKPNRSHDYAFRSAAHAFNMIPDIHEHIVVPWGVAGRRLVNAFTKLNGETPSHTLMRQAQRYTVGVSKTQIKVLAAKGIISPITENLWTNHIGYDNTVGLTGF